MNLTGLGTVLMGRYMLCDTNGRGSKGFQMYLKTDILHLQVHACVHTQLAYYILVMANLFTRGIQYQKRIILSPPSTQYSLI